MRFKQSEKERKNALERREEKRSEYGKVISKEGKEGKENCQETRKAIVYVTSIFFLRYATRRAGKTKKNLANTVKRF